MYTNNEDLLIGLYFYCLLKSCDHAVAYIIHILHLTHI